MQRLSALAATILVCILFAASPAHSEDKPPLQSTMQSAVKLCEGKFFGGFIDIGSTNVIDGRACECLKNISEVIGNPLDIVNSIKSIKDTIKSFESLKALPDFAKFLQEFEKLVTEAGEGFDKDIATIGKGTWHDITTGVGDMCKGGAAFLKNIVGMLTNLQALMISSKDKEGYTRGTVNYQQHENRIAKLAADRVAIEKILARVEGVCAAIGCIGRIGAMGTDIIKIVKDPMVQDYVATNPGQAIVDMGPAAVIAVPLPVVVAAHVFTPTPVQVGTVNPIHLGAADGTNYGGQVINEHSGGRCQWNWSGTFTGWCGRSAPNTDNWCEQKCRGSALCQEACLNHIDSWCRGSSTSYLHCKF